MNSVNKTLYIPLYGKAYVSRKGLFLKDPKAEELWAAEGFEIKGKSRSRYLAYYMGIRAAVFDAWVVQQAAAMPDAAVIHIGCGLDSRVLRTDLPNSWYDVDFPEVIAQRKRCYAESGHYRMIPGDARNDQWLDLIPQHRCAIVVMEGLSMYLTHEELLALTDGLSRRFQSLVCLMDCYTTLAAKASAYRNPINDVGVTQVYGLDDPLLLQRNRFTFVKEHCMTPRQYIDELTGAERFIFSKLYAGRLSEKLYRLYEYEA